MGLFSNKNKPCPICGGATPRLLATKIQGEPICGDCAGNISADPDLVASWTLSDAKEHFRFRDENQKLVDSFAPTRTFDCGNEILIDDNRRMLYIKEWASSNPPVVQFDEIMGYELSLDWEVVESWSKGMQRIPYQPPQMGLVGSLVALADAFGGDDKDDDSKSETFKLVLKLNHSYLRELEVLDISVDGDDALEFERNLGIEMSKINMACNAIVSIAGAPGAAPAAPTSANAVDDIKKFKELLDAGIITQQEFDAKKKQLLGI